MKSLDRKSFEEQARLVSRYVAGDLSRSERGEFEAWLVASPELAAEVEMERRLRRGIASAARRGWIQRQEPVKTPRDRHWQVAIAASAVLSLGVVLSLVIPRGETTVTGKRLFANAGEQGIASTRTISLGSVRGTGGVPDVSVLLTDAPNELVIEPDVVVLTCPDGAIELECAGRSAPHIPQYDEYEMDLVKRHGATLTWRSSRQIPVGRTQLSFTLHEPGNFDAGDYDLLVRGHSTDHSEVVARFWLRVSAQ